jgi:DsbC/DsbD-like thiol-disulfide interchange protein
MKIRPRDTFRSTQPVQTFASRSLPALLVAGLLAVAYTQPAGAATSPWQTHDGVALRLLAVPGTAPGQYRAALEMVLDPGLKTYWRTPGASGVPPLFEWTRSTNLADAAVRFPAPGVFDDAGEAGFGYGKRVVFPIAMTARTAGEPVDVHLDLDFAVCRDICIPVRANLELKLDGELARDDAAAPIVAAADATIPVAAQIGEGGPLAVEAVQIDRHSVPPVLHVTVRSERGLPQIFVETPDAWPLARARTAGRYGATHEFSVKLPRYDGRSPAALLLTVVSENRGIEVPIDPATLPGVDGSLASAPKP